MAKVYRRSDKAQSRVPKSVHVSVSQQTLTLKNGRKNVRKFPVSTSAFGLGTEEGSMKTPLGQFRIAKKIGGTESTGTVFKERKPVSPKAARSLGGDLVMSRILWLDGMEEHNANTFDRYIYIHGTNHEEDIGRPASHGCVRMRNDDVVELFRLVRVGTRVIIKE